MKVLTTEPIIRVVPSAANELIIESVFEHVEASQLLRFWTEPELLVRWWPQQADIDAKLGGRYCFRWPSMDWELYGTITAYVPPTDWGFTWSWRHQPETPVREVYVHLSQRDSGTHLRLRHGTYTEADSEERDGHRDGWLHFLAQLHAAVSGTEQ